MPAPDWEDLDVFLELQDFAVPGIVHFMDDNAEPTGETRSVTVIYDDPYLNAELGEYDLDTRDPRALGKETELAGIRRGDRLEVIGKLFDILEKPMADGTGMATLRLSDRQV